MRTHTQLVQERNRHINRIHKILETANIKLSSVVTDILGKSARQMLEALIEGQSDPVELAKPARGRMRPKMAPTGCATRLKGENVAPSSPGLASTHRIERRPLGTAQGCKDVTGSIIQRAKCHNARIHVAADRNTNILKLYRHPFFRRRISPQKQL